MTKSIDSSHSDGEKLIGDFIGIMLTAIFLPDELQPKGKSQVPAVITNDVTVL